LVVTMFALLSAKLIEDNQFCISNLT